MEEVLKFQAVNIAIGLVFCYGYTRRKYRWILYLGLAFIIPAIFELSVFVLIKDADNVPVLGFIGQILFFGLVVLTIFTMFQEFGQYREKLKEKEKERKKKRK
ncbi:hypothetical protein PRVXT_001716 [Proteinivorax tanatarense]|uniref:Uncharacterized protein n=1 Tax=Proteinivorax tanatarense TaxID=1260629 RepID=A0AAU7VI87_9FIRM